MFYTESNPEKADILMLIHGAGGSLVQWPRKLRRLPTHRVIAIDLPGHGRSTNEGFDTLEDAADTLEHLIREKDFKNITLIGHSMGGAIALLLALRKSLQSRLTQLILISTSTCIALESGWIEALSLRKPQAIDWFIDRLYRPGAPEKLKDLTRNELEKGQIETWIRDLKACTKTDISEQISKISTPTFILSGGEDRLIPPETIRKLQEQIPNAKLCFLKDTGHLVLLEQPELVLEKIEQILYEGKDTTN